MKKLCLYIIYMFIYLYTYLYLYIYIHIYFLSKSVTIVYKIRLEPPSNKGFSLVTVWYRLGYTRYTFRSY